MAYLNSTVGNTRQGRQFVVAKTTAYTVTAADSGKVLTTRGASAPVTFTLPTASAALNGVHVKIISLANQAMTIATQTADQLVVLNDLTADSVAASTSSEIIGAAFECICDGTGWIAIPMLWEAQTPVIAS